MQVLTLRLLLPPCQPQSGHEVPQDFGPVIKQLHSTAPDQSGKGILQSVSLCEFTACLDHTTKARKMMGHQQIGTQACNHDLNKLSAQFNARACGLEHVHKS